jgi:CoA:oxalate CoA-transferase
MLVTVVDSAGGEVKLAGNPVKLSGFADPSARGAISDIDADREQILAELAADDG